MFVKDIRNPISLAKLILDTSSQPLSLRRVPPNALVGEGARIFAEEHGMITFANEYLVSKNSRDRFFRWQEDLLRAEERVQESRGGLQSSSTTMACVPCQYDTASTLDTRKSFPRDHTAAIMAGTWNEGQPDSPYAGTPAPDSASMQEALQFQPRSHGSPSTPTSTSPRPSTRVSLSPTVLAETRNTGLLPLQAKHSHRRADVAVDSQDPPGTVRRKALDSLQHNNVSEGIDYTYRQSNQSGNSLSALDDLQGIKRPFHEANQLNETDGPVAKRQVRLNTKDEDVITDTIGAIAIDDQGRIAAGSSSGGIGMKHRGRLGPAALVGIGTAVVPCAEEDDDGMTVAAVTSGTGEHMATTMASQRCAERIYQGTRRAPGGGDMQDDDEDAIMESFIAEDFMGHPGVKNCNSQGAIGVMVVKKCRTGYYLYFAHNTDSFALASMGALEKEPRCTMSRLPDSAKIAKGGRKIRIS